MSIEDLQSAAARMVATSEEQPKPNEPEQEVLEEETPEAQDDVEVEETEGEDYEEPEVGAEVGDDSTDETEEATEKDTSEPFYSVKVDGEEYEVNLEELQKGYQLEKSYTKKAQAVAEERAAIAEQTQKLEEQRTQYLQATEMVARQQAVGVEAARAKLAQIDRTADPLGFVTTQLEVQELEQGLQTQVQQYQAAIHQREQAMAATRAEQLAHSAQVLQETIPDWGQELQRDVVTFAKTAGYTDAELNNIVNARDIVVLNKARLYDELVAGKETVKGKKKAVIRPKVKSPAPKSKQLRSARQVKEQKAQLKSSGSLRDAANLIKTRM